MRLTVAVDKFRETATAEEVTAAVSSAASALGWEVVAVPMADGGEGLLEALGGATRTSTVLDPAGRAVEAAWRLDGGVAVVESARASGLTLVGGHAHNDPVSASSVGTGQLIAAAIDEGATEIIVGLGGSATTDGGMGALAALEEHLEALGSGQVRLTVCHDVQTRYLEAALVFGPQKGATPEQVELLTSRLREQRAELLARFGTDPQALPGSGAAGGLGGALAVVGGVLTPGVEHVAAHQHLDAAIAASGLVITGEGKLDATSLAGKVVGGVLAHARAAGVRAAVLAGVAAIDATEVGEGVEVVSLSEEYGAERAWHDVRACLAEATTTLLRGR